MANNNTAPEDEHPDLALIDPEQEPDLFPLMNKLLSDCPVAEKRDRAVWEEYKQEVMQQGN